MENHALHAYCLSHSTRPSALAGELEAHTRAQVPGSQMLIGEAEASLLAVLLKACGARRVVEVGTFTGYSALAMAEQLPEDGTVTTLDVNPGTTAIARRFWDRSPHGKKITALLGPARDLLGKIEGPVDFVFVDADKPNYPHYVSWALERLSPGGMLVIDNALWSGRVVQSSPDEHTRGIMEAARLASSSPGFTTTLVPVRDGMLLAHKGR